MNSVSAKFRQLAGWAIRPLPVLIFVVTFTIAYFLLAHEGFYFNDDYFYAQLAGQVQNGTFQFRDLPAFHRILIFGPVAGLYQLLGITIFTVTLWPLLCTVGSVIFIYFLFRREEEWVTVWALILTGLNFHTLFLSTYLFPDNILMFFALVAAGLLYAARRTGTGKAVWYALGFVLANFAALLAKETIVYYLPFYLVIAASDFYRKKHTVFWLIAIGLGILMLGGYFWFYKLHFGSLFYRFTMVENTNLIMEGNYVTNPGKALIPRLTIAPALFFIGSGLFFTMAFCFRFFYSGSKSNLFDFSYGGNYWFWLALIVLLQYWFGSTSVNFYNPITLIPRMATPMFIPFAIAAGFQLKEYFRKPNGGLYFAIPLLLAALLANSFLSIIYGLPAYYFFAFWWRNRDQRKYPLPYWFLLILLTVLCLRPLHFMRKPSVSGFFPQEKVVRAFIGNTTNKTVLFTDGWVEQSAPYYFNFNPNRNIQVRNYLAVDSINTSEKVDYYMLLNEKTSVNPDLQYYPPNPRYNLTVAEIYNLFPNRKLVAETGPVRLFQIFPKN